MPIGLLGGEAAESSTSSPPRWFEKGSLSVVRWAAKGSSIISAGSEAGEVVVSLIAV